MHKQKYEGWIRTVEMNTWHISPANIMFIKNWTVRMCVHFENDNSITLNQRHWSNQIVSLDLVTKFFGIGKTLLQLCAKLFWKLFLPYTCECLYALSRSFHDSSRGSNRVTLNFYSKFKLWQIKNRCSHIVCSRRL